MTLEINLLIDSTGMLLEDLIQEVGVQIRYAGKFSL